MRSNQILSLFLSRTGQIVTVSWKRPLKTLKDYNNLTLEKSVTMQCRAGVTYDNMKSVQEKRESGELPEQNQGLSWGRWKIFPYVIEHKDQLYLRFSKINSNFKSRIGYFMDGEEVSKEQVELLCLASEFRHDAKELDVFNVKLENILEIK